MSADSSVNRSRATTTTRPAHSFKYIGGDFVAFPPTRPLFEAEHAKSIRDFEWKVFDASSNGLTYGDIEPRGTIQRRAFIEVYALCQRSGPIRGDLPFLLARLD
jgi:hypothetical protein